MREDEEVLAARQAESLRCFAEDVFAQISQRLDNGCATFTKENQMSYTIGFDTVDSFSVVLMGSETDNADCFQSMLLFDRFTDLLISDRRPLDEYKMRLIELVCSLVGKKVCISETVKRHSERRIRYSVLDANGDWETVADEKKLGGVGAFLLLWKSGENKLVCDLSFN